MNNSFLGNLLGCISCCGSDKREAEHVLQPLNLSTRSTTTLDQLVQQSHLARTRLYSKLGNLQDFALSQPDLQANLVGAPRWPTSQQIYRVIKRPGNLVMIVSDGLSDPFDDLQPDANVNGYGLEFYIITPASEIGTTMSEITSSWQFQLLHTVCSLAAGHGGIRHIIDDLGLLSTEAEGVSDRIPQTFKSKLVNKALRVGALLGLQQHATQESPLQHSTEISSGAIPRMIDDMPITDVRLVSIKLISLAELKLITELGSEGRKKLSELFQGQLRLVSSLERPSVL